MISQLAYKAFKQMFSDKQKPVPLPEGIEFDVSYTTSNLTRIVTRIPHPKGWIRLTFLEQNPYKNSVYGQRAKNGAKIMWVIANMNNVEQWLGRVEDARWYPK